MPDAKGNFRGISVPRDLPSESNDYIEQLLARAERAEKELELVRHNHADRVGDLARMRQDRDEAQRETERLKVQRDELVPLACGEGGDHDPRCDDDCGPCGGTGGVEANRCLYCGGSGKCQGCSVGYRLRVCRRELKELREQWADGTLLKEAQDRVRQLEADEDSIGGRPPVLPRDADRIRVVLKVIDGKKLVGNEDAALYYAREQLETKLKALEAK